MTRPAVGQHGTVVAEVLEGTGVTVVGETDAGLNLKFDGDEHVFPLGWAAVESGRFVEFEE